MTRNRDDWDISIGILLSSMEACLTSISVNVIDYEGNLTEEQEDKLRKIYKELLEIQDAV